MGSMNGDFINSPMTQKCHLLPNFIFCSKFGKF
jgi:hypothetical protein